MAGKLIGVAAVIVNGKEMSFYEWRKTDEYKRRVARRKEGTQTVDYAERIMQQWDNPLVPMREAGELESNRRERRERERETRLQQGTQTVVIDGQTVERGSVDHAELLMQQWDNALAPMRQAGELESNRRERREREERERRQHEERGINEDNRRQMAVVKRVVDRLRNRENGDTAGRIDWTTLNVRSDVVKFRRQGYCLEDAAVLAERCMAERERVVCYGRPG